MTHYPYKIFVSQARNWHPVDANSLGMTAIIEFSPLNLMRFLSTMHQVKAIEKSVHQRYSFLFNTSHVVRKHQDYQETCRTFFSKSCSERHAKSFSQGNSLSLNQNPVLKRREYAKAKKEPSYLQAEELKMNEFNLFNPKYHYPFLFK